MKKEPLKVAILGDTGWDILTHDVVDNVTHRPSILPWHDPKTIADLYIPAGARFAAIALNEALRNASPCPIEVRCFLPQQSAMSSYSTFEPTLAFLKDYEWDRGRANPGGKCISSRIHRFSPYDLSPKNEVQASTSSLCLDESMLASYDPDILLISEACGRWLTESPGLLAWIGTFLKKQGNRVEPNVIVNLNGALPRVQIASSGRAEFVTPIWKLLAECADQVCVLCSATTLRQAGARLSWRLSWEQSIEDLAAELLHFDQLRAMARFRDVVIRFGVVAAAHLRTQGRNRAAHLTFAPLAREGVYRDRLDHGEIIAKSTILAGALIHEIAQSKDNADSTKRGTAEPDKLFRAPSELFSAAMSRGLLATMRIFDRGYGKFEDAKSKDPENAGDEFVRQFVNVDEKESLLSMMKPTSECKEQCLRTITVPPDVIQRPANEPPGRRPRWQILGHQLNKHSADDVTKGGMNTPGPVLRINLGIAIVLFGHENVLNRDFLDETNPNPNAQRHELDTAICSVLSSGDCEASTEETADHITLPRHNLPIMPVDFPRPPVAPSRSLPITTPVIEFGKLVTIERSDVESFRSIHNLLKTYVESEGQAGAYATPISIAVFGPPGSGKSFAVKQIAKCIKAGQKDVLEQVEYNVAQFRTIDDLSDAVMRLTSIRAQGKIPLVFFDEFDCDLNGPLGWLRYFLAPMQDGIFYGASQTINFGRAIFVFAGGVHVSFDDFDPTSDRHAPHGDHGSSEEFKQRLAMFKNQKGPDFVSRLRGHIDILSVNATESHTKHIIRRAIVLRSLIEAASLVRREHGCSVAHVDEDVLYAFLTVDRFRHGTRSMEAILQMCNPIHGRIEKSSLPSRAQLNMHVNADEFFIRMFRGRFRWKPRSEDGQPDHVKNVDPKPIPKEPGSNEMDGRTEAMGLEADLPGKIAETSPHKPESPAPKKDELET